MKRRINTSKFIISALTLGFFMDSSIIYSDKTKIDDFYGILKFQK